MATVSSHFPTPQHHLSPFAGNMASPDLLTPNFSGSESPTLLEQQQYIVNLLKGQKFTMPYLSKSLLGWRAGCNPHYEKIKSEEEAFLDQWVEKENLREMAKKVDLSGCIAWFFPHTSAEKLQVLFEKMAWFFAFDDDCDNFLKADEFAKQQIIPFIKYWLDPNRAGPEPEVYQSCFIYRSVGPKLSTGWSEASKAQFLDSMVEYVTCLTEVAKQRETYLPSVVEYLEGRIINIGVYPTLDLIPYASDIEIPSEVLKHESLQTIRYHVVRIICLTNDLFSIKKEIRDAQFDNIMPLLMLHHDMSLQNAANHTVGLIEESYTKVNDAEKRLPEVGENLKPDLLEYVAQCKDQASGSVFWHEKSPRYLPKSAYGETEVLVQL